jgi:hypothetical protein
MRNFSDYERRVLDKLCRVDPTELITISKFISDQIFTLNSGLVLAFLPERGEAILYLKGSLEDASNRQRMVEFLDLISLIEYLRSERYIHNIHFAATAGLFIMGEGISDPSQNDEGDVVLNKQGHHIKPADAGWIYNADDYREYQGLILKKNESSLFDVIGSFVSSPLVPTQELMDFVDNGYKTTEDLRYAQSKLYTKIALSVAIFFGLVSTFIGISSLFKGCG